MPETYSNNIGTTLAADINPVATTLTVQSLVGFPATPEFRIKIEGELMLVTAMDGSTWTVQRGIEGTFPATHPAGAFVNHYLTAAALGRIISEGTTAAMTPNTPAAGQILVHDGTAFKNVAITGDATIDETGHVTVLGSGGSGGGTQSGTGPVANLPATANAGDEYWPSDSIYKYRYSGTAWEAWGPMWKMTPPPQTGWNWIGGNQGNETVTISTSGLLNVSFLNDGIGTPRWYGRPLPTPPYTITMLLSCAFGGSSNDGLTAVWFGRTSYSFGVAVIFRAYLHVVYYTVNAGNSNWSGIYDNARGRFMPMPMWLRLRDDGAEQSLWWTPDGVNWIKDSVVSWGSGSWNQIAIGGEGYQSTASISLLSYTVS